MNDLAMSKRRHIYFETLADALADAKQLRDGYRRAGNWSLGQICHHLGTAMRYSREGFPSQWPKFIQAITRFMALRGIQSRKTTRIRFPVPIDPPVELPDVEGVEYFAGGIECFEQDTPDYCPHIVFGEMSPEQWRQFHLWHCEHHFSFLVPEKKTKPDWHTLNE